MNVLVPVDRSQFSKKAFEYVLEELQDPKITLLHVLDPVGTWAYSGEDSFDFDSYRQEEEQRRIEAEQLLNDYRDRATDLGLTTETTLEIGKPARRILEAVDEFEIDHIVMGSRGRSGLGRVLLGSVAETVTRRSPVPVTIIR
jgi:nucleotide-binding universal stress UspA family protein